MLQSIPSLLDILYQILQHVHGGQISVADIALQPQLEDVKDKVQYAAASPGQSSAHRKFSTAVESSN